MSQLSRFRDSLASLLLRLTTDEYPLLLVLLAILQWRNFRLAWILFICLLAAGVSLWFGLVVDHKNYEG